MSAVPPALRLSVEVSITNVIKKMIAVSLFEFFFAFFSKMLCLRLRDSIVKINTLLQVLRLCI